MVESGKKVSEWGISMKNKTWWILGLGVMVLFMAIGNYGTYRFAWSKMEEMQTDYENRMAEQVEIRVTKELEKKAGKVVEEKIQERKKSILASAKEDTLTVNTVYEIENYNSQKGTTSTEYETLPEDLIGSSREEVDSYCKKYMKEVSPEEYLKGLQSIGVVSFSKERLVIKKIFDTSKVKYRYYLIAVDGEVVAYYGDKKTVYEYTGIETKALSKKERQALKKGIEVKDEDQLYNILENYSS